MTDIPDEIVERVARAMANRWSSATHINQPYDTLSAVTQQVWRWCAIEALASSGWAEMREALMHQVERTLPDGTPCFCSHPPGHGVDHFNWCHEARAALAGRKP